MKISELREKDTASLQNLEKELTENLFTARLQHKTGQLENTARIGNTRHELAQIKTVLRARELGLEVLETGVDKTEKKSKGTHDGKTEVAKVAKSTTKTEKSAKGKSKPAAKAKAKSASKPAAKAKAKSASKTKTGKKK